MQQQTVVFRKKSGISEAIILAGGLGTRLREAVPDLPKSMAPVAGRPFLSYIIDALRLQGIEQFCFALGFGADVIEAYLAEQYPTLPYKTVIEKEPLGTGGAIQLAMQACTTENVLVTNGDTLFKIDVKTLEETHLQKGAESTLVLKPMQNFDRYGVVQITENGQILSFQEKQFYQQGLISGGVYLVNRQKFLNRSLPQKFSIEKDYMEKFAAEGVLFGCVQESYFIDIGIPEDYNKAQADLQAQPLDLKAVDEKWTLFLDRDGVINIEIVGQYVLNTEQFHFSSGVLEAMPILGKKFGKIIVVSNQRGVSRGLMTEADLQAIHQQMLKNISAAGGRIDQIYYCTDKEPHCFYRKPNPGMAVQAYLDYPEIDAEKSIMVGNKPSDMQFGRAAGMYTVFLTTTNPNEPFPHPDVDLRFASLLQLAEALQS